MDGEQVTRTESSPLSAEGAIDLVPATREKQLPAVTDEEAWAAIEETRFYAPLDRRKFEAKLLFGKYLTARLNTDALVVNIVETLELMQEAMRVATQLAQDDKFAAKDRIAAICACSSAANSISAITTHAESMLAKSQPVKSNRRNLPPPTASNLILAQNVTFPPQDSAKNGQ